MLKLKYDHNQPEQTPPAPASLEQRKPTAIADQNKSTIQRILATESKAKKARGSSAKNPTAKPSTPLFDFQDTEAAWQMYCQKYGDPGVKPTEITIQELRQSRDRPRADYLITWPEQHSPGTQTFTIRQSNSKGIIIYRFPHDPALPGLRQLVETDKALKLIKKQVPRARGKLKRLSVVRYRPESRAIIKHTMDNHVYYARCVRKDDYQPLLQSREVIQDSRFKLPQPAGLWHQGYVVWEQEAPGENLHQLIANQEPSTANAFPEIFRSILDCLQSVWELRVPKNQKAYNLESHHSNARKVIARFRMHDDFYRNFEKAAVQLAPFSSRWTPTATAHNDFYDDQVIIGPEQEIIMVDYDSIAAGDPMLDVGRFLAYAKWANLKDPRPAFENAYDIMRHAALEQFEWNATDLNIREAICIFGLCQFPATRPGDRAVTQLENGIAEILDLLN